MCDLDLSQRGLDRVLDVFLRSCFFLNRLCVTLGVCQEVPLEQAMRSYGCKGKSLQVYTSKR